VDVVVFEVAVVFYETADRSSVTVGSSSDSTMHDHSSKFAVAHRE